MAFITLGADEARSQQYAEGGNPRISIFGKLLTSVALAGGAIIALKSRSSQNRRANSFGDTGEITRRIPRETASQLMDALKSTDRPAYREVRMSDFSDDWGHEPTKTIPVETSGQLLAGKRC